MLGASPMELVFVGFLVALIAIAPKVGPAGAAIGGWLHRLRRRGRSGEGR